MTCSYRDRGKKLCTKVGCIECKDRRVPIELLRKYWRKDLNGNVNPITDLVKGSHNIKYWWNCKLCGHLIDKNVAQFIRTDGCIYCSRSNRYACCCLNEECSICEPNRIPREYRHLWYAKLNSENVLSIRSFSNKSAWFLCKNCRHLIQLPVYNFIRGEECRYCSNRDVCNDNECEICKRFSLHPMSQYWSKNNQIDPGKVGMYSKEKFEFDCPYCQSKYSSSLNSITNGSWCSCRKNKTEKLVLSWLREFYPQESISYQVVMNGLGKKRYDIVIESMMIIIEVDGPQHFKQISVWAGPECNQQRDIEKIEYAIDNSYTIIHILQEDIYYKRFAWQDLLIELIHEYTIPICIFVSSTNDYEIFHIPEVRNKGLMMEGYVL